MKVILRHLRSQWQSTRIELRQRMQLYRRFLMPFFIFLEIGILYGVISSLWMHNLLGTSLSVLLFFVIYRIYAKISSKYRDNEIHDSPNNIPSKEQSGKLMPITTEDARRALDEVERILRQGHMHNE